MVQGSTLRVGSFECRLYAEMASWLHGPARVTMGLGGLIANAEVAAIPGADWVAAASLSSQPSLPPVAMSPGF
jgi:hypothetical protein